VCVCTYIFMYIGMYIYIYICMCMYVYMCIYVCVHIEYYDLINEICPVAAGLSFTKSPVTCKYACVCTYVSTYVFMYIYIYSFPVAAAILFTKKTNM